MNEKKLNLLVNFHLINETSSKKITVMVNRFTPLINYKRQIENAARVDLYGRKLIFRTSKSQTMEEEIDYLQEFFDNTGGMEPIGPTDLDVLYEEMGG
jgi:hypothetical protein